MPNGIFKYLFIYRDYKIELGYLESFICKIIIVVTFILISIFSVKGLLYILQSNNKAKFDNHIEEDKGNTITIE